MLPIRRVPLLLLPLIASLGLASCAGTPPPEPSRPPQEPRESPQADTEPPPAPAPAPQAAQAPQAASEEITAATRPGQAVDVVDPGGERGPVSLVEAARAERERRARTGPPVAVINDQNVKKSTGQITIAAPKKPAASPATEEALEALKDEQYWRSRALDIRTRLREATDRIHDLELSAAGWRRRFYAEEDPYFRDGKIKPEWDRVLARLEEQRREIETTRKELDDFLEEGRRAGALPGWLREGGELEPEKETPPDRPGIAQPSDPQIYEEPRPPYREDAA